MFKAFYGWHDPCKVRGSHACEPTSVSHVLQGFIPTAALFYNGSTTCCCIWWVYTFFLWILTSLKIRWYYVCKWEGPVGCVPCNANCLRVLFKAFKRWYWLKNFINEFCTFAILYMVGKREWFCGWCLFSKEALDLILDKLYKYIRILKGFSKVKACLHVRRLKAQKSYVWTTSKPVCSKQNAFLRVVIPQGKTCDRTDGRMFQ